MFAHEQADIPRRKPVIWLTPLKWIPTAAEKLSMYVVQANQSFFKLSIHSVDIILGLAEAST